MTRRILSLTLVLCMLLSMLPVPALAEEQTCLCDVLCTRDAVNASCPVCGPEDADLTKCAHYQAPVTVPPTTEAPATEAPTTEAPTTEPPATEPPATVPPTTVPPATEAPTVPPTSEPTVTPTTVPPTTEAPTEPSTQPTVKVEEDSSSKGAKKAVVDEASAVASFGGVFYDSLPEALTEAATTGGEVRLLQDVQDLPALTLSNYADTAISLDLNGLSVSFDTDQSLKIQGRISLTISNGTVTVKELTMDGGYSSLTLNSVTLKGSIYANSSSGELRISGVTMDGAFTCMNTQAATITGGTFAFGSDQFYMYLGRGANLTISGGTFTGGLSVQSPDSYKLKDILASGLAVRQADGQWLEGDALDTSDIAETFTVRSIPLTAVTIDSGSLTDGGTVYLSAAPTLSASVTPAGASGVTYEWFNGEASLGTAQTLDLSALPAGDYTLTCKATRDGYTLTSAPLTFTLAQCTHKVNGHSYVNTATGICTQCNQRVNIAYGIKGSNTTYYKDMASVSRNAGTKDSLHLYCDAEGDLTVTKTVTNGLDVNLESHILTGSVSVNGGAVTLQNGTVTGSTVTVASGASLTLKNMTFPNGLTVSGGKTIADVLADGYGVKVGSDWVTLQPGQTNLSGNVKILPMPLSSITIDSGDLTDGGTVSSAAAPTISASVTPAGASGVTYQWFNGEDATPLGTGQTLDLSTLPEGSYTLTCKATRDGYTLTSAPLSFTIEACTHRNPYGWTTDSTGKCTTCGAQVFIAYATDADGGYGFQDMGDLNDNAELHPDITFYCDASGNFDPWVEESVAITLNLAGHKLDGTLTVPADTSLTVHNGTVTGSTVTVASGASLTLYDLTFPNGLTVNGATIADVLADGYGIKADGDWVALGDGQTTQPGKVEILPAPLTQISPISYTPEKVYVGEPITFDWDVSGNVDHYSLYYQNPGSGALWFTVVKTLPYDGFVPGQTGEYKFYLEASSKDGYALNSEVVTVPVFEAVATVTTSAGDVTYYEKLEDALAFAAANSAADAPATVALLKNAQVTGSNIYTLSGGNLIFDFGDYTATFSNGLLLTGGAKVTLRGGILSSYLVEASVGEFNVSGGTLSVSRLHYSETLGRGKGTISGGTFRNPSGTQFNLIPGQKGALSISGGTFEKGILLGYNEFTLQDVLAPGYGLKKVSGWCTPAELGNTYVAETVTVLPLPLTLKTDLPAEKTIAEGSAETLTFEVNTTSAQPVTYEWKIDGAAQTETANTLNLSALTPGSYSVQCAAICDGYRLESTTCSLTVKAPVATVTIGSNVTSYADLGDALIYAAASSNADTPATVALLANAPLNPKDNASGFDLNGGNIILDFGSYTATVNARGAYGLEVDGNAIVTLKSGKISGNLRVTDGQLHINGGSVTGDVRFYSFHTNRGTITGGTFAHASNWQYPRFIVQSPDGQLSITGGRFLGGIELANSGSWRKLQNVIASGYGLQKDDGSWVTDLNVLKVDGNVTVKPLPLVITDQTRSANVLVDESFNLSVTVDDSRGIQGGTTYSWSYCKLDADGKEGDRIDLTEQTASQLTMSLSEQGSYRFYCVATNSGYSVTSAPISVTVGPIDLNAATATVTPASTDYTGADITPTVSLTDAGGKTIAADDYTVTYMKDGQQVDAPKDAGTYTIRITPSGSNRASGTKDAAFTVNPKQLTVTLGGSAAKTYDGNKTASLTGLTFTPVGVADSDTVTVTAASAVYAQSDVGPGIAVTASGLTLDNSNYTLPGDYTVSGFVGEITPKSLEVKPVSQTISYGADVPAFTITGSASDYVAGEGDELLTGTPTFICGYQKGSPVGNYDIHIIDTAPVTAKNYTVHFATGILTVEQAVNTVTIVGDLSRTYNGQPMDNPNVAVTFASGTSYTWYAADDRENPLESAPKDAGDYVVVAHTDATKNFTDATSDPKSFTISPKPIEIQVTGKASKVYDGNDTASLTGLTFTALDVEQGDTVNVVTTNASAVYAQSDVGTDIAVTVSGLTLDNPNYKLPDNYTVSAAVGAITPAEIQLKVGDQEILYGTSFDLSKCTFDPEGFVNEEDASVLSGTPVYQCGYAPFDPVGTYEITMTGISAANYTCKVIPGTLTVRQADNAVTIVGDLSRIYNGQPVADPTVTTTFPAAAAFTWYAADDMENPLESAPKDAGDYVVVAHTDATDNFTAATSDPKSFTISPKPIEIQVTGKASKVYDGNDTASLDGLTFTALDVEQGDTVNVVTTNASAQYKSVDASPTVTMAILNLALDNPNYKLHSNLMYSVGEITPRPITGPLTVAGDAKVGGTLTPTFSEADATVTWQWFREGEDTPISTSPDYAPVEADIGRTLTVVVTGTGNYTGSLRATVGPVTYFHDIILPENPEGYTIECDKEEVDWNDTARLTVTLLGGYTATEDFKVKADGVELRLVDGKYVIENTNVRQDIVVTVEGVADRTAPTGEISAAGSSWNSLTTSGVIYITRSQTVTITAADEQGSGVKEISYCLADSFLTEAELAAQTWTKYDAPFPVTPAPRLVVYARIVDNADNPALLSTCVLVLDDRAPVISGIRDGRSYYDNDGVTFTVTDDNLASVTVDGRPVLPDRSGRYHIPADNKSHTVVARDHAGHSTTVTVSVFEVYTVTYIANGKTVSTQQVGYGKDANPPAIPRRPGYTQTAPYWDHDGKDIRQDTTITAVYLRDADKTETPGELEDVDGILYRLVLSEGITEALPRIPALDTTAKVEAYLLRAAQNKLRGVTDKTTVYWEAELRMSTDDGKTWQHADASHFPASGLTVTIPYPDGTTRSEYDFVVVHMFTETDVTHGAIAGVTETPTVTKTRDGLQVTVKSLSPISVSWVKKAASSGSSWWRNPKTGDVIRFALAALGISFVALCGIGGYELWKKKRRK